MLRDESEGRRKGMKKVVAKEDAGFCERYELKIDYVAMDQVCTWSHYKVDILLYD